MNIYMRGEIVKTDPLISILLVEDDYDDIELFEGALLDNGMAHSLQVISEGDKVISFLNTCKILPNLIVLDFNLPQKHGKEILEEIKSDKRLSPIPLIVLTTSSYKEDFDFSYKMGVNHFITKPTSVEGFNNMSDLIYKLVYVTDED